MVRRFLVTFHAQAGEQQADEPQQADDAMATYVALLRQVRLCEGPGARGPWGHHLGMYTTSLGCCACHAAAAPLSDCAVYNQALVSTRSRGC
jgi:hypothetical protein